MQTGGVRTGCVEPHSRSSLPDPKHPSVLHRIHVCSPKSPGPLGCRGIHQRRLAYPRLGSSRLTRATYKPSPYLIAFAVSRKADELIVLETGRGASPQACQRSNLAVPEGE